MSEIKQYRCDVPGCTNVTESPLMAKISYARSMPEIAELKKMAAGRGHEFSDHEALMTSLVEKGFDLCTDHYNELKNKYFTQPQATAPAATAPAA